jgi:hypothetical protein
VEEEEEENGKRKILNHSLFIKPDSAFGRSSDIVRVPFRTVSV